MNKTNKIDVGDFVYVNFEDEFFASPARRWKDFGVILNVNVNSKNEMVSYIVYFADGVVTTWVPSVRITLLNKAR